MRLVRYQTQDQRPRLGLLENGQIYDLETMSGGRAAGGDMRAFLAQGQAVIDEVASAARAGHPAPEDSVSLLAPIANPGKIGAELSPLALWTPRLVAIGILFLMLLTVLIVFRGG